jgi:hypothetical protein
MEAVSQGEASEVFLFFSLKKKASFLCRILSQVVAGTSWQNIKAYNVWIFEDFQ